MKATVKGKKDVIIKQVDDRTTCYTLMQAGQSESAFFDISTIKRGVLSSDDQNNIVINQDGMEIVFDQQVKTRVARCVKGMCCQVKYNLLNMLLQLWIL